MPEKYLRRDGLPILLRHTGPSTLPEEPPVAGDRKSVLCLHDAGLQSSVFGDLLMTLSDTAGEGTGFTGLSFDLPGHGRSGGLDSLSSIADMTAVARWVADWCAIERPILVGHGMGALVALEWARDRADDLGGLVLCGVGRSLAIDSESIEAMRAVTHGKAPRPFDPTRVAKDAAPEVMKRAYIEGIQTDPRATLGDLEAIRAWCDANDPARSVGSVACSTCFVDGAAEASAIRERTAEFTNAFDSASSVAVDQAAHYLPFEQPQALAEQVRLLAEAA